MSSCPRSQTLTWQLDIKISGKWNLHIDTTQIISLLSLAFFHTHMGWVWSAMLQMLCKDSAALGQFLAANSFPRSRPRVPAFTRSRSRVWGWVTQRELSWRLSQDQYNWAGIAISCSDTASSIIIIITVIIITQNIHCDETLSAHLSSPGAMTWHTW